MATFLGRTCRLHQQMSGARRYIQRHSLRYVSTTSEKKQYDIPFSPEDIADETKRKELHKRLEEHFKDEDLSSPKNRIFYGYEDSVAEVDVFSYHTVWWFWFVIPLVVGVAIFNFALNDYGLRNWSSREARLLMEEREKKGLPYIDKNYIDPNSIELPSEEDIKAWDVKIRI